MTTNQRKDDYYQDAYAYQESRRKHHLRGSRPRRHLSEGEYQVFSSCYFIHVLKAYHLDVKIFYESLVEQRILGSSKLGDKLCCKRQKW